MRIDMDTHPAFARKFARICRFLLPVLAAFVSIATGVSAQRVDAVIAKNAQARGGLEKLKAERSLRTTEKFSEASFRAEFRQENKRPTKLREDSIDKAMAQIQSIARTT